VEEEEPARASGWHQEGGRSVGGVEKEGRQQTQRVPTVQRSWEGDCRTLGA
jgi:hypothetical protein